MFTLHDFTSGADALFQFAGETVPIPSGYGGAPSPALPSSFTRPYFVQTGGSDDDSGAHPDYGMGSRYPQVVLRGGSNHRQEVEWGIIPDDLLLPLCLPAGEYLPNVCLMTGAKSPGVGATGRASALRFAKCDGVQVDLHGDCVSAKAQFWGLTDEPITYPTVVPLAAASLDRAPFTWQDVKEINVFGVPSRTHLDRVTVSTRYDLHTTTYRPDYGAGNPWSGTTYQLREGNFAFESWLVFNAADAKQNLIESRVPGADALYIKIQNQAGKQLIIRGQYGLEANASRRRGVGVTLTTKLPLIFTNLTFQFGTVTPTPTTPTEPAPTAPGKLPVEAQPNDDTTALL